MLENRPRNQPYGMVCHSCQNAPRNTKECKSCRSSPLVSSLQPLRGFPCQLWIHPDSLCEPLSSYLSLSSSDLVSCGIKVTAHESFLCKWKKEPDGLQRDRCWKCRVHTPVCASRSLWSLSGPVTWMDKKGLKARHNPCTLKPSKFPPFLFSFCSHRFKYAPLHVCKLSALLDFVLHRSLSAHFKTPCTWQPCKNKKETPFSLMQ